MQSPLLPAGVGVFDHKQFMIWRIIPNKETGNPDKVPLHPQTGKAHNAHDPAAWVDYPTAKALAEYWKADGVSFTFTDADPFFFLDLDDHLQSDGTWSPLALDLCRQFAGCAMEVSWSGKGLHIFGRGHAGPHRCKPTEEICVDLYTEKRFVALTFGGWKGDAAFNAQAPLSALAARYFPPDTADGEIDPEWTGYPSRDWNGPEDDEELIRVMLRSNSTQGIYGNRATILDLWTADADQLGKFYPHDQGLRPYDPSRADAALCQHLAFWTGKDCERIDRLFRKSDLMRDKWDDRGDYYSHRTIKRAVQRCENVYSRPTPQNAAPEVLSEAGVPVARSSFMGVSGQQEHFKGCVYVRDLHRAFVPDGALLKPEQFKAMYGGYTFSMDSINGKTSKSAWEVFTESQSQDFPKAYSVCFRPEIEPGSIVHEGGVSLVNTYVPIDTPRTQGDATPFLDHVAKLLPVVNDRAILLAYMAACVQYPGVKFQWCPMLQGCEGNGKTLLVNCLAESIGWKYSHMPNAGDLANKFNSWILSKMFIGVEEIFTRDSQEVLETLKPMITNSRIEIQGKGSDQITGDNRANFFMCSNHKDAIRKSTLDRRFAVFFTDQQRPGDLQRCGMDGSYFPDLYRWLRATGYAVVNDYLRTYRIPEALNPSGACHRAPMTTSTNEALCVSMGPVEQQIQEAIESDTLGFMGGWVSSMALTRLLVNRRISHHKMYEIIEGFGYIKHPGLVEGRVTAVLPIEGGKPRLYIKQDSPAAAITGAAEIAGAYVAAQGQQ